MIGFIIDLCLNMWLFPSLFRAHIVHATILTGCTHEQERPRKKKDHVPYNKASNR